jgi:hypothetical protein
MSSSRPILPSLAARAQVRAAPVDPIVPGLHDTGVADNGQKLKAGDPDPHFHVSGPVSGTPRVIGPSALPGDWIDRQDSSRWISIAADAIAPEGTYRYEMKIDLTGFDPSSVSIGGMWGVDNAGAGRRGGSHRQRPHRPGPRAVAERHAPPGAERVRRPDRRCGASHDSSRSTVAAELGFWPIADLRLGLGYNFRDTTDPFGRDRQGRPRGAYVTLSTKLAHLFDLLGSTPAPPARP